MCPCIMVNIEIVKQIVTIQWRSVFSSSTPPPTILIYKLEMFSWFTVSSGSQSLQLMKVFCMHVQLRFSVHLYLRFDRPWITGYFRTLFLLNPKKTRIEFFFFLHGLISGVIFNYCILYTSWRP